MKKRPRRIPWIVAICAAVLVGLLVGGWWLRNPIASFVATRAMKSQGLSCNPVDVRVPSAAPPSPIELAPMRCESSGALSSQFISMRRFTSTLKVSALAWCIQILSLSRFVPSRIVTSS
jgi:hypothetical protein